MKISINLYQDSLKPKKEYLTLKNVVIASVVSLLIMVSWAGAIYYKNEKLLAKNQQLTTEQGFVEQELKNYQTALVKHNDSATFTDQKVRLERELQVKSILLNEIMSKRSGRNIDFYQVMKDLTEHHDHDLWLTDFMFNRDEVLFNGYTTQSHSVTRWLTYLQATDSFKGREFKHLKVVVVDDQILSFEAGTSHRVEATAGDGL